MLSPLIPFLSIMAYISTGKAVGWTCDFVGSYHKYQATNCCFCEDGSLLAVSFEEIVTIWDSETWELKCTFCQRAGKIRYGNPFGEYVALLSFTCLNFGENLGFYPKIAYR